MQKRFKFCFFDQPGMRRVWIPWAMKTDLWTLQTLIQQSKYIGMVRGSTSKVLPDEVLMPTIERVLEPLPERNQ